MKSALAAFKFLTLLGRIRAVPLSPRQAGAGIPYFPLVGLMLGVVLTTVNRTLEPRLESEILSVTLVTLLILLTGAIPLEGLQKTFDAWPARTCLGNADVKPGGVFGLLAALIVVLFKINSLEAIGETRGLSLLLTPAFARWGLVIFLYGSTSAAEQSARAMADNVKAWHLIVTTVAILALAVLLVGRVGLWIGLSVSLFALISRNYLQRSRGGLTCDSFGAVIELCEALSFIVFATL